MTPCSTGANGMGLEETRPSMTNRGGMATSSRGSLAPEGGLVSIRRSASRAGRSSSLSRALESANLSSFQGRLTRGVSAGGRGGRAWWSSRGRQRNIGLLPLHRSGDLATARLDEVSLGMWIRMVVFVVLLLVLIQRGEWANAYFRLVYRKSVAFPMLDDDDLTFASHGSAEIVYDNVSDVTGPPAPLPPDAWDSVRLDPLESLGDYSDALSRPTFPQTSLSSSFVTTSTHPSMNLFVGAYDIGDAALPDVDRLRQFPECDVCRMLVFSGIFAPVESELFRRVLRRKSSASFAASNNRPPLVVDVGANIGYFTTYAAMLGCRVVAIEPQRAPRALLYRSLATSGLTNRVRLFDGVLTAKESKVDELAEQNASGGGPSTKYMCEGDQWGTTGLVDEPEPGRDCHAVAMTTLARLVQEPVELLKIDTEGAEAEVMTAVRGFMDEFPVNHIIVEVKKHVSEEKRAMLEWLVNRGYRMCNYGERYWRRAEDVTGYVCYNLTAALLGYDSDGLSRRMWARASEDFWFEKREAVNSSAGEQARP